ncbi:patatin-like phospholipase family protein [Mucilaginibacter antarcticus]|uniref:Patatin-like phospholipase family protein n=1 Tax=Mucilaginibacter antarcticus TaxID=1855725 RepID=A0ABW5XP35_9SPHI
MNTIGLVLSGGGARGIAHLGVLQGIEEIGIKPKVISGVSAGAVIGALYAAGYTPRQILGIAKNHSPTNIVTAVITAGGLFSPEILKGVLLEAIPQNSFESLKILLFVTATDIGNCSSITTSKGVLCDVLVGSAAIPALFDPVPYQHRLLVDGGVLNNFPVECLAGNCDKLIGSHVNKLLSSKSGPFSRLQVLERCFHLAIADKVLAQAKFCDILIEPQLPQYNMFEMKYAEEIFEIGYRCAMMQKESLLLLTK